MHVDPRFSTFLYLTSIIEIGLLGLDCSKLPPLLVPQNQLPNDPKTTFDPYSAERTLHNVTVLAALGTNGNVLAGLEQYASFLLQTNDAVD